MKLVFITPRLDVNDGVFGFTERWARELAKNVEKLYIITPKKGKFSLPENSKVFSLEKSGNALGKFFLFQKILSELILKEKIDSIFCHMYVEFAFLSAILAKLFRKKMFLWYHHGTADTKLKLATFLVNKVLSASEKGFRLQTKKLTVLGHGIDTNYFKPSQKAVKKIVLSVGRISPTKDQMTLLKASRILWDKGKDFDLQIIGKPLSEKDQDYYDELKGFSRGLKDRKKTEFLGKIPYSEILDYFQKSYLFVNNSYTGSLDKVVLEAMSCEIPVITSNEAFFGELKDFPECLVSHKNEEELAAKMEYFISNPKYSIEIGKALRQIVVKNHSLETLAKKIINEING